MKIIDKRRPQTVDFRTLEAGQPFYYPAEELYGIRLAEETTLRENIIDIETGDLYELCDLDEVIPIKGQFEILE